VFGGLGATWIWWGTALVAVVAVARHIAAARRAGRRPSRVAIALVAAVPIDELRVEVRNIDPAPLFGLLGTLTGRVRLLVGPDTIALRGITSGGIRVSGFGSSFGTFGLLDYMFRPADCEVERPRMGVSSFSVSLGKPAIVLRCADGRRTVELVLSRPAITTLEDVQRELIWAGARALDGQPVGEPARLHRPAPAPRAAAAVLAAPAGVASGRSERGLATNERWPGRSCTNVARPT
jgi:hypothetical protein